MTQLGQAQPGPRYTCARRQLYTLHESVCHHDTHNPWTLKLSNMISAVFSLFSGGLSGGSV